AVQRVHVPARRELGDRDQLRAGVGREQRPHRKGAPASEPPRVGAADLIARAADTMVASDVTTHEASWAPGGSAEAFGGVVDPFRRELLVHCYPVLGSLAHSHTR